MWRRLKEPDRVSCIICDIRLADDDDDDDDDDDEDEDDDDDESLKEGGRVEMSNK